MLWGILCAVKFLWGGISPSDVYKLTAYWQSCRVLFYVVIIMMTSSNGNVSALLAICAWNSPVPGEFPLQRPVTRGFDAFFDLRLNKQMRNQSWGSWLETLSRPLWRHCNTMPHVQLIISKSYFFQRFHSCSLMPVFLHSCKKTQWCHYCLVNCLTLRQFVVHIFLLRRFNKGIYFCVIF